MIPKFFSAGEAPDPIYTFHRDHPSRERVRDAIEAMWTRFAPFCGDDLNHFVADARAHFVQRTWELRLACTLLDKGFQLRRPPENGPDLCVLMDGTPVWVEATAPTSGTGVGSSDLRSRLGQVFSIDRDAIILRYTSALWDKCKQRKKFLQRGAIAEGDAFAVAINAACIEDSDIRRPNLPDDIVRSVYPIGDPVLRFPVRLGDDLAMGPPAPSVHVPPRWTITKRSTGKDIPTCAFLDQEFAGISALLFSTQGIWNVRDLHGDDWIVVHNLCGASPLRRGAMRWGLEYWIESTPEPHLKSEDWRVRSSRT